MKTENHLRICEAQIIKISKIKILRRIPKLRSDLYNSYKKSVRENALKALIKYI